MFCSEYYKKTFLNSAFCNFEHILTNLKGENYCFKHIFGITIKFPIQ